MKPRVTRRRGALAPFLLACAVACAGCAYSLISGGKVNAPQASKVEQGVQRIRQLSFKQHVPVVLKTPNQVEQMVLADLHRDFSDAQLDADGKAGAMLGLYPPGIDLKAETVKLLKSQIAGFYEPHDKEMVLVEGATPVPISDRMLEFVVQRDLVNDMLLAHELTHALQDQNFALQDKLDALQDNSDREMALKSVAEGDATIAGFAYIAGRMDDSVVDTLAASMKDLPETFAAQSKDTPEGLGYPLIFQYSEGVRFVGEAYKRGGWKAVDALYAKPPQSTQQLIDPSLYFDNPLPPVAVEVAGYQPILKDWTKADEDTFGELSIQIILQLGFGKDAPEVALAKKWAGDRMAILSHNSDVAVIWIVVFRDDHSAGQFEDAYTKLLDRTRASTPHRIERRGDAVLVITGALAREAASFAPPVWKASKIGAVKPAVIPAHPIKADAVGAMVLPWRTKRKGSPAHRAEEPSNTAV
jgi:hypothetical protein